MREIESQMPGRAKLFERFGRWIMLAAFATASIAFTVAPLAAISWSHVPFAGFLVEQTLVVNGYSGEGWSGRLAGIAYPQRVKRVGGVAVTTSSELNAALSLHTIGEKITILSELPDGTEYLFPSVSLIKFPTGDLIRLFWLPYFIGLAYLGIAVWIYWVRGSTSPGRSLAFFCVSTALACGLFFDLSTTHVGSAIWTVAVAQMGGALITLAHHFPEERKTGSKRSWLIAIPYAISVLLAGWGLLSLKSALNPWAYITAWGNSYLYAALGIFVFLAMMLYSARTSDSPVVQRQARIVLMGSALAFGPVTVWFLAPLFGISSVFNAALIMPALLLFPVSVAIAALRYRLWEINVIVNRAIVYGLLTAILAGVFAASTGLLQRLFVILTGDRSDAAIVIATLVIASAISPIRAWLQGHVDKQFKESSDSVPGLRAFGQQVRSFIQMSDVEQITQHFLGEAAEALQAESGAISLLFNGKLETIHTYGHWRGEAWLSIPLECRSEQYGLLMLGPRLNRSQYPQQDFDVLIDIAAQVSWAIWLARGKVGAVQVQFDSRNQLHDVNPGNDSGAEIAVQTSIGSNEGNLKRIT